MDGSICKNGVARSKKILVVHRYLNVIGGAEEVLLKILEVLIERKYDIFMIGELPSGSIFDNLSISSIKQIPYESKVDSKSKRFTAYRSLFRLSRLGRKLRKKVGEMDLEISTQDPIYFINTGKKRVAYVHFPAYLKRMQDPHLKHRWFWKLYYWPITFQFNQQLKKVDLLLCNSCFTQTAVMDCWNREAEIVYPPVDVESFKPLKKEFFVISVGRFTPEKNYELVVEVAKRMPNVKFVIAGRKCSGDSYFDKIVALKPDNVELIADVSRVELSELLGRAKVYLHCMIGEHFGISVGEAMAAGCVPVVHDSGGPKEIMGSYGFLYSSVEACVKAVEAALQSDVDPNDVAERAKLFSSDNFKKNFIEILEKNLFL